MSRGDLSVSVVIPTKGREQVLMDTLSSLQNQIYKPDEIIVVDQNPQPSLNILNFLKSIPTARHVHNQKQGLVENYNRCLKEAKGEIIIFVDDDVLVEPELVLSHLGIYSDLTVGAVAGRVRSLKDEKNSGKSSPAAKFNRWTGQVAFEFNSPNFGIIQFAQGANMSFRRKYLLEAGGFDSKFDGNGYFFETEAGLRLERLGFRTVFCPQADLIHLVEKSGGARIHDKAIHTYHFTKNGIRLARRYSPKLALPLVIINKTSYALAKALYNRNLKIFSLACKGLWEGFSGPSEFQNTL